MGYYQTCTLALSCKCMYSIFVMNLTQYMVLMFVLYIVHAVYMYELCIHVYMYKCVSCMCIAVYHYAYMYLMCVVLFGTQVPILPSQTSANTLLPVVIQRPPTV